MIRWLAFDADDTLWENEKYYHEGQEKLAAILAAYYPAADVDAILLETETRNLPWYGYGIKSFGLSMIEVAVQLSNGVVSGSEITGIIDHLKEMLAHPTELLPGVEQTLNRLRGKYRMLVITKGDLLDQERKLVKSPLQGFFEAYEIVSAKSEQVYSGILERYQIDPHEFLMVGNSLRSDILPVINIGAYGVYIPHHTTWAHEVPEDYHCSSDRFFEIESFPEILSILERINKSQPA
mgnify:CR=1 FL=1